MGTEDVERLRTLEQENSQLKKILAKHELLGASKEAKEVLSL